MKLYKASYILVTIQMNVYKKHHFWYCKISRNCGSNFSVCV